MKLIDGDATVNTLCELRDNAIKWFADCRAQQSAMTQRAEQAVLTFNECISQVKKSSEVDAVPVVRCRDCEYWKHNSFVLNHDYCELTSTACEGDHFCSWGEKKDDA